MTGKFRRYHYEVAPCLKISHSKGYTETGIKQYHYDPDLIIDYFKKSSGNIIIHGAVYKINSGDVVILNPSELHFCQLEPCDTAERVSLHINKALLDGFDCSADEFFEVFYKQGKGNIIPADIVSKLGIDRIIEKLLELFQSENKNRNILARCQALELVSLIEQAVNVYDPEQYDCIENPKLKEILYYINHNYTENITLASISKKFFYSKYHICMLFKKYIGISLTDYITIRRIHYVNQLISQKVPIAEACTMAGFNNYSNFYRLYKKHMNITPLEYRTQINEA